MKKILLSFFLLFGILGFSQTKQTKIKELLTMSGQANIGIQVLNQFVGQFKTAYPNVPEKFWEDFLKEVNAEDLINAIVPVYDKYYTENDIDEMIKFYQSPVGIKMTNNLQNIFMESQEAGRKWGMEIAEKVFKKLEDEKYLQSPPPPMNSSSPPLPMK